MNFIIKMMVLTVVLGIAGVATIGLLEGFWDALGVCLLLWGDNINKSINKTLEQKEK